MDSALTELQLTDHLTTAPEMVVMVNGGTWLRRSGGGGVAPGSGGEGGICTVDAG